MSILLTKQFRARCLLVHTQLRTCMLQQCHYTRMFPSTPPNPLALLLEHTPLLHTHTLINLGSCHTHEKQGSKECLLSIITRSSKSNLMHQMMYIWNHCRDVYVYCYLVCVRLKTTTQQQQQIQLSVLTTELLLWLYLDKLTDVQWLLYLQGHSCYGMLSDTSKCDVQWLLAARSRL